MENTISTFELGDGCVIVRKEDFETLKWQIEQLERGLRIYKEVMYSHIENLNAHKEGFKK